MVNILNRSIELFTGYKLNKVEGIRLLLSYASAFGALFYMFWALDVLPDAIPIIGWLDDIMVAFLVFMWLLPSLLTPKRLRKGMWMRIFTGKPWGKLNAVQQWFYLAWVLGILLGLMILPIAWTIALPFTAVTALDEMLLVFIWVVLGRTITGYLGGRK